MNPSVTDFLNKSTWSFKELIGPSSLEEATWIGPGLILLFISSPHPPIGQAGETLVSAGQCWLGTGATALKAKGRAQLLEDYLHSLVLLSMRKAQQRSPSLGWGVLPSSSSLTGAIGIPLIKLIPLLTPICLSGYSLVCIFAEQREAVISLSKFLFKISKIKNKAYS